MWGAILGAASAAMGLFSSMKQKEATEDAAERTADEKLRVAQDNAELSLYDADVVERAARETEYRNGVELAMNTKIMTKYMETLRAGAAKAGVAVGTGTPLDIEVYSIKNLVADLEMAKYNGMKAVEKQRDLADRYRLLASKGMSESASWASNILETAKDQANANLLLGVTKTASEVYKVGEKASWWD